MKRVGVFLLICVFAGFSGAALGAGDPVAGKAKAQVCAACHGPNGNSENPLWPVLAGGSPSYLLKQLEDFKSGARKNPTMSAMAATLSLQDMEDVAAYFGSQPRLAARGAYLSSRLGERLYKNGSLADGIPACLSCHGADGQGNASAGVPVVAGQHAPYSAQQLMDFRSGTRSNDRDGVMRKVARVLTDSQIDAVAAYMQALH